MPSLIDAGTNSIRPGKSDYSIYGGIYLLSTSYKILFNPLLSRLSTYTEVIIGDQHLGSRYNRSNTDQIFCIHQLL
jgi:hypothetical protein